jgi:hypothetical protein
VKEIFIYGLYTEKSKIKYVGKTINLDKRLKQHVLNSKNKKTHKDIWIQKCISEGKNIGIDLLEVCCEKTWQDRERFWIKYYRNVGSLTNHLDGGERGREIIYKKSYEEVKDWVKSNLQIKSSNDWDKNIKLINLPDFIPRSPREVYLNRGWISWGDFLGTENKFSNDVSYISYEEAKVWIKDNLNDVNTLIAWKNKAKLNTIPNFIPNRPERYYSFKNRGWVSWGDFLGTGNITNKLKKFINYEECSSYAKKLKIKTKNEWVKNCKKKIRPINIPSNPDKEYENKGWVSWGEFLGTGKISDNKKNENFISHDDARIFIKKHYPLINSSIKWSNLFSGTSKDLPFFIPLNPQVTYKNKGWKGWGYFLETGNVMNKDKIFPTYEEAKKMIKNFNIKSNKEWRIFSKKEGKKLNLPSAPDRTYKNKGWTDWGDFLSKKKSVN